jgi:hypothetical protein
LAFPARHLTTSRPVLTSRRSARSPTFYQLASFYQFLWDKMDK